ncbi:hypothetical protein [Bacillus sp. Hm123]|uniref:hypothetical protein n=1 Tax=Bacillus sp. Hm123 TaxID=3450745 RepID=UPI003F43B1C9
MSNPKITTDHYNTQMSLPLEVKEETSVSKRTLSPTFKPYQSSQSQTILDIEA